MPRVNDPWIPYYYELECPGVPEAVITILVMMVVVLRTGETELSAMVARAPAKTAITIAEAKRTLVCALCPFSGVAMETALAEVQRCRG